MARSEFWQRRTGEWVEGEACAGFRGCWQFQGFVGVLPLPAAQKWERRSFGAAQVETGAAKPLLAV